MKRTITTLALAAILAGTSHAAISGRKPAFMDKQQLAAMRAEATSNSIKETEDSAFFTGKPYLDAVDAYAFKYRTYDPSVARWTSEDPSGFPDGANGSHYAPTPTVAFDYAGLISVNFKVVTEIRAGAQAGMKSTHIVQVDTDTGMITTDIYATGTTNIPGIGSVGSRNDDFTGTLNSVSNCHINLTMSGSTASMAFPAAIDYSFTINLDLNSSNNGAAYLWAHHDGYPSYEYYVDNTKYYDFQEQNLTDLFGIKDILVGQSFDTGITNHLCE